MIELKDGMTILFQGDSITDAGRDREDYYNLGNGYAVLVATYINSLFPEKKISFINRGVSCECTVDMVRRWEKDCLDINPDVLVFMGGINDMWRRYDGADTITTPEEYEKNLRTLMDSAKEKGIKNVILMEPYLTMNEPDRKIWLKEDLCFKQEIVKKLSQEYSFEFIPLQKVFNEACQKREPAFWTMEGVHPKWPGCGLIAKEILKVFGYSL
ncbi:MAG: SGNH/GDSL hydrolase family protein [Armatimonadetes bacterium]|nr:SGNH/GDSL hydrolase family protein [Candidatus Hippobium faecium]